MSDAQRVDARHPTARQTGSHPTVSDSDALRSDARRAGTCRIEPMLVDAAFAVVVTTAIAVAVTAQVEPDARDPDVVAYGFAVVLGALMLVRRRWPAGVLVATVVLLFGYYLLGYPAVGVGVPVAGAVYSAAEQGRLRIAMVVASLVLVLSTVYRALEDEPLVRLLGFDGAENLILLVAVIALGDGVRSRRELRRRSAVEAEAAARAHELEARRRVEEERLRIAREVHDVLAHAVSAISIQSQVGLEALPGEPDVASAALRTIREVSSTALTDLRSAVGVLRDPARGTDGVSPDDPADAAREPVGGLAQLDRLLGVAAEGGMTAEIHRTGNTATVPLVVDAAAYRIVQESLTNVRRHSPGSTGVVVQIDVHADRLELRVRNTEDRSTPGTVRPAAGHDAGPGFGLAGMRERAELLGGSLAAGHVDGGFEVRAVLPFPSAQSAPPRPAGRRGTVLRDVPS
ncbi:sensor histidine kinase [Nakamurella sp. GG22]